MIEPGVIPVEPWAVREPRLDLDLLAQTESLFALSNGHLGLRANLDEGEPHGLPGTYLNSVYETRVLPYAEAGYGYPESGQTVINVTNGKLLRLLVDDEPFDVRYGTVLRHERVLDLRRGVLERVAEWESPIGRRIRVTSTRVVSLTHRSVAAIRYRVEPLDGEPVRVVVQSELVTNEALPAVSGDPRVAAQLERPLEPLHRELSGLQAVLVHGTRRSGLRVAAAMDHAVSSGADCRTETDLGDDLARVSVSCSLEPGEHLELTKLLAYGWSSTRSVPALRDQVAAALTAARQTGWDGLLEEQRAYLDDFWECADVEVDGDPELQQAVRFALFHVLQSGARAENRPIPAKGLTGNGYDGHVFWDSETFVLPLLTYTVPCAAADQLRWRLSTLPLARERARQLGLRGAAFPWRTIAGEECSAYWPAGTAAFHVNADIADAAVRLVQARGDDALEAEVALPLLVETARMWVSLGHHVDDRGFRIDGVTGPDEYSALADNNAFTNLMAAHNLRSAADVVERHPEAAAALEVEPEEAQRWRAAADGVVLPYDESLGVHPQSEGFTEHSPWDFEATAPEQYPLLLHFPYVQLYPHQVVKQADLVLALHLRGECFTAEQKARDFAYYEALTVRDSSLSACTQAVVAAEVGALDLALDYAGEAALMDLRDLESNTRDGVHMASLAGAWIALVAGFGGMRDHGGRLALAPRLPGGISRLSFGLRWRDQLLRVVVRPDEATYELVRGGASGRLEVTHHGEPLVVAEGEPVTRPLPPPPTPPRGIRQPPGRAPRRRGRPA